MLLPTMMAIIIFYILYKPNRIISAILAGTE